MIQPNFNLMLWIILISLVINAICKILLGVAEEEKNTKYGIGEVVDGILTLVVVAAVLLW